MLIVNCFFLYAWIEFCGDVLECLFMVLRYGNVGLAIAMCTSFYIEAF